MKRIDKERPIKLDTGDGYIVISIDVARKWRDEIDRQIKRYKKRS